VPNIAFPTGNIVALTMQQYTAVASDGTRFVTLYIEGRKAGEKQEGN
jgi:hypothetical protein